MKQDDWKQEGKEEEGQLEKTRQEQVSDLGKLRQLS